MRGRHKFGWRHGGRDYWRGRDGGERGDGDDRGDGGDRNNGGVGVSLTIFVAPFFYERGHRGGFGEGELRGE